MREPLATVILPAFNNAGTIEAAIRSAQEQTVREIEIIVVDDGSIDDTAAIVSGIAGHDLRVRLLRHPRNRGASAARNTALAAARGHWVAVLDADDRYAPERLERLLQTGTAQSADLVCDELQLLDLGLNRIFDHPRHAGNRLRPLTASVLFREDTPFRYYPLGYVKPVIRRDFLRQSGVQYDVRYPVCHDFVLLAELLLHRASAWLLPEALYIYTVRWAPVSQTASPHGRVRGQTSFIIQACEQLLNNYAGTLTPDEARWLNGRWRLLRKAEDYRAIKQLLLGGQPAAGLARLAIAPGLWSFAVNTLYVQARRFALCRRMRGALGQDAG